MSRKSGRSSPVAVPDTRAMLRLFTRHTPLLVALLLSTTIGALAAGYNTRGNLLVAAATTQVMVDYPDASILDRTAHTQDVLTLEKRAELYGRLMTTPPVLEAIAHRAGLPPGQLSAVARTTADVPIPLLEPDSEERANQIRDSRAPYRLELQSHPWEPILAIYAEAPSFDEARRLADSSLLGLQDYLRGVARDEKIRVTALPRLRQLGEARGGVTNGKATVMIGGLTFLPVFTFSLAGLIALRRWRRRQKEDARPRPVLHSRLTGRAAADWPRTTRLLPWSIAGLITMIWLTPFDKIQLAIPTPVDLTLDRLVLPAIGLLWLIACFAGPAAAPRLRLTKVHLAMAAFLACAFVSVVVEARYLNQSGELKLAFKKLPLLVSYMSIFVIVASSVRRSEVPALMTYTFVLAVVCGVGVIYEYRFKQNLFDSWSSKVFAGPFKFVSDAVGSNVAGIDSQGRRWIQGPTIYGVELITMLSIAMPIGILGILKSKTRSRKILYGLGIVILIAAMFATNRKSAMLAPAASVLTLAYFRRRELLSLAPLGLILPVMVAVLSPGAVQGVVSQFTRSDAGQLATVSDRKSDYDA